MGRNWVRIKETEKQLCITNAVAPRHLVGPGTNSSEFQIMQKNEGEYGLQGRDILGCRKSVSGCRQNVTGEKMVQRWLWVQV